VAFVHHLTGRDHGMGPRTDSFTSGSALNFSRGRSGEIGGEGTAPECAIAGRATSVPHATGTTQLTVYEANLDPGDRLRARLWHGFSDQVSADVTFQTRRIGDSIQLDDQPRSAHPHANRAGARYGG